MAAAAFFPQPQAGRAAPQDEQQHGGGWPPLCLGALFCKGIYKYFEDIDQAQQDYASSSHDCSTISRTLRLYSRRFSL
eukprot:CAMPEP_0118968386 /NCGR_PEP_ID=MMETSP1173-20130426/5604_1 /TAXON_ID=1034831 /ORGANISM="Rhizochromulina marina cf, Strain CCMP1243" /LENGTH=77 /DNA_ID=CAMNT_0006917487 /DNA_START=45 /DNA_END=278 /DNA_ORIENTATION=+